MAKYSRKRYGKRGFKKAYRKRSRYGKSRVPSGTRLVRGALRTGGSYAVGQARAELKYCDSLLWNITLNGPNIDWSVQSKAQTAGSPSNVGPSAQFLAFSQFSGANAAGSNYAGLVGQPGLILNNVTQGTDATQRIGRKIQIKSIRILITAKVYTSQIDTAGEETAGPPLTYEESANPAVPPQTARVVLVWDKQPNGQQATSFDVFTDMNGKRGSSSMMNLDNRDRFVILADEKRSIGPYGTGTAVFDIYKECDLTTIFSTAADPQTIASIASGCLYAFFLGDADVVANPLAVVSSTFLSASHAQCRIRFLDA